MIKKIRKMFLKGEMWGHGIKAHQKCYCVCSLNVGKWSPTSTKIPWYKPSNRPALSFFLFYYYYYYYFMKWEWQNNEYSYFFDNAQLTTSVFAPINMKIKMKFQRIRKGMVESGNRDKESSRRVGFSIFKLKWNFLEGVLLTNTIACIFIHRSAIFFYWIQYMRTNNAWCV